MLIPELGVAAPIAIVDGRGHAAIAASPERWSPHKPKLYDVVFRFGADEARDRIGFRTVETRGTDIVLNGEPIWLKGVCVHEDDIRLGKVSTEEDVRRRFRHARELGCNFLRLAHYPHHEHVARIADEEGFLLWAEVPVYWAIDFADPATLADARNQLAELIQRDINGRASSCGASATRMPTRTRVSRSCPIWPLQRSVWTRPGLVSAACLINRETFRIEDRLAAQLDVIGLNEYFGWYEPDFSGLDRLLANSDPGKPVIVSETGADAATGHRGAGRVLFTEDWQAEFYREQLKRIAEASYVSGIAAWLLYDFRTERRQTGFQKGFNRKGLIAEDKERRKLAFEAFGKWRPPGTC